MNSRCPGPINVCSVGQVLRRVKRNRTGCGVQTEHGFLKVIGLNSYSLGNAHPPLWLRWICYCHSHLSSQWWVDSVGWEANESYKVCLHICHYYHRFPENWSLTEFPNVSHNLRQQTYPSSPTLQSVFHVITLGRWCKNSSSTSRSVSNIKKCFTAFTRDTYRLLAGDWVHMQD